MKLLIDRMRPFVPSRKLKGKKWVVVSPSGEGPKSCRLLVEMLRLSCDYLGMKYAGKILARAFEKGEIKKDQKALEKPLIWGCLYRRLKLTEAGLYTWNKPILFHISYSLYCQSFDPSIISNVRGEN